MLKIINIAFTTGSVETYTVPSNIGSMAIHAADGDVIMTSEAGGDEWTIYEGEKESLNTRDISNEVIYFSGSTGTTLEIRLMKGVLS